MTAKMKLHTLLGQYPNVAALRNGQLRSDLVEFDFADVKVPNTAFKPLVRQARFDLSEVAIVTFLQAKAYGKPYVLLPLVVMGRGAHQTLAYNPARGRLTSSDLSGKRVGVRSYTVTTGVYVRGFLADDYGIDLNSIQWVTFEDAHVAEYHDPANVTRAPEGKNLTQMLLDGEIDAAIVGETLPDPRLAHLVPDPESANRQWANKHGGVPINHVMVVRDTISKTRPDVVREVFRLLKEAKSAANLPTTGKPLDPYRFGLAAMRPTLETVIDYCVHQNMIPRRFSVEELCDETTTLLS